MPQRSLDSLIWQSLEPTDRIAVLKIDTEGAEGLVLQGARRLFMEKPPRFVIIEIFPRSLSRLGTSPSDLINILHSHGYVACAVVGMRREYARLRRTRCGNMAQLVRRAL